MLNPFFKQALSDCHLALRVQGISHGNIFANICKGNRACRIVEPIWHKGRADNGSVSFVARFIVRIPVERIIRHEAVVREVWART